MPDDANTTLILDKIESVHRDTKERLEGVHKRVDGVDDRLRDVSKDTGEFRVDLARLEERMEHAKDGGPGAVRRATESGAAAGLWVGLVEALKALARGDT